MVKKLEIGTEEDGRITYSQLSGVEQVNNGPRPGGQQQRCKLTSSDDSQYPDDEPAEPVTDDYQLLPDLQMLLQHICYICFLLKHSGEALQP